MPCCTGGVNLQPHFQKGVLTRSQFLEGGSWEGGGDLFRGGENSQLIGRK